jgi:hypothetical protein
MVPAPTSVLCGSHTRQPCAAQYSCRRLMASWKLGAALLPAPAAPLLLLLLALALLSACRCSAPGATGAAAGAAAAAAAAALRCRCRPRGSPSCAAVLAAGSARRRCCLPAGPKLRACSTDAPLLADRAGRVVVHLLGTGLIAARDSLQRPDVSVPLLSMLCVLLLLKLVVMVVLVVLLQPCVHLIAVGAVRRLRSISGVGTHPARHHTHHSLSRSCAVGQRCMTLLPAGSSHTHQKAATLQSEPAIEARPRNHRAPGARRCCCVVPPATNKSDTRQLRLT